MQKVCSWLLILYGPALTGCGLVRIYPPVAVVERLTNIYPEPRPPNCKLAVLNTPPSEPYEVFAQVVSYAGSADMGEKMQSLIKNNACEIGADAIVLLPMQHIDHVNTEASYPDWIVAQESSVERFQHWVDKRYSVAQRAIALVFKRGTSADSKKLGL
jgi:hypothetical protein